MGLEPLQPDSEHEVTVSTPEGDVTETVDGDTTIGSGISNQGSISDLEPGDSGSSGYYSSGRVDKSELNRVDTAEFDGFEVGSVSLEVELENHGLIVATYGIESGGGLHGSINLENSFREYIIPQEVGGGWEKKGAGTHTITLEHDDDDLIRYVKVVAFEFE